MSLQPIQSYLVQESVLPSSISSTEAPVLHECMVLQLRRGQAAGDLAVIALPYESSNSKTLESLQIVPIAADSSCISTGIPAKYTALLQVGDPDSCLIRSYTIFSGRMNPRGNNMTLIFERNQRSMKGQYVLVVGNRCYTWRTSGKREWDPDVSFQMVPSFDKSQVIARSWPEDRTKELEIYSLNWQGLTAELICFTAILIQEDIALRRCEIMRGSRGNAGVATTLAGGIASALISALAG